MQFTTKVILWVTCAHFFALMIIGTFSKQKTPHTYKTENIQGLLYTPEKIVTSINLLSPNDIVFENLNVFNNRSVFRALAAYPGIRNNPLDASTENKALPVNTDTEKETLPSDISAADETISLGAGKEDATLPADADAGNESDASNSDTEKDNLAADDDTVPLNAVTDNETPPAENGALSLNKGAENDTAPLDENLTPLVSQALIPEDDYCYQVDHYNLQHLDNMFKEKNFFTNFLPGAIRRQVLNDVGKVLLRGKKGANLLDKRVTTFFTNTSDYHNHREIGKDFLCATQMYNHIPGSQNLTTKDRSLDLYSSYVAKYNGSQECLNSGLPALPKSYRLHVKEECEAFFDIVNSEEYQNISDSTPLQYLIKPGNDSHRGHGIELFTKEMRSRLNEIYDAGNDCGYWQKSLIAQSYVSNPMLLNLRNKFDFKVYMLVASTNPLIVYYHDGYLRASLSEYNKTLLEKGVHITNTQANVEKFDETVERLEGFATEEEIKRQQLWTFEDFEDMLINMGTIQARGWLSEYLRPTFQKAMIHVARMSKEAFSKESNVFQLFGLDFLIDQDMKVWYLEANDNVHFRLDTEKIAGLTIIMLKDMFDIQYAYYRARMKRVVNIIRHVEKEMKEKGSTDFYKWQEEYQEAVQNKLDPEYKIRNDNSFRLIIDENLKGADVYKGHLPKGCF